MSTLLKQNVVCGQPRDTSDLKEEELDVTRKLRPVVRYEENVSTKQYPLFVEILTDVNQMFRGKSMLLPVIWEISRRA